MATEAGARQYLQLVRAITRSKGRFVIGSSQTSGLVANLTVVFYDLTAVRIHSEGEVEEDICA